MAAMSASGVPPVLDAQQSLTLKRRVLRFCMGLAGLAYLRKTLVSLFQQRAMLRLQDIPLGRATTAVMISAAAHAQPPQRDLLWRMIKYTFTAQIIAASEYLIPLVKPLLAARIGKLLVWKGPRIEPNAVYGPHERNTVDIYGVERAASDGERRAAEPHKPVLVFVHGGAWSFGHKWQYGLVGEYLAATLGFLVAVVNYRTYPSGHVQDMVEDVDQAVEWVTANCHLFGGDRHKIFLSGHSSGAHVGALALIQSAMRMMSADHKQKRKSELAQLVRGFIGLAGPYDIADHYVFESERMIGPIRGVHEISTMKPAVLGVENFQVHSPTALAAELKRSAGKRFKLPMFHALHGLDDTVVPSSSSEKLTQALRRAGHDAEFAAISNCTHEDIIFAVMGDNVPCRAQVVERIQRIVQQSGRDADSAAPSDRSVARKSSSVRVITAKL